MTPTELAREMRANAVRLREQMQDDVIPNGSYLSFKAMAETWTTAARLVEQITDIGCGNCGLTMDEPVPFILLGRSVTVCQACADAANGAVA